MSRAGRIPQLRTTFFQDVNTNQMQDSVRDMAAIQNSKPEAHTSLLEDCTLEAAYQNKIVHSLGRVPQGFRIEHTDTFSSFRGISMDDRYLIVETTNDCVVDVVVY